MSEDGVNFVFVVRNYVCHGTDVKLEAPLSRHYLICGVLVARYSIEEYLFKP